MSNGNSTGQQDAWQAFCKLAGDRTATATTGLDDAAPARHRPSTRVLLINEKVAPTTRAFLGPYTIRDQYELVVLDLDSQRSMRWPEPPGTSGEFMGR